MRFQRYTLKMGYNRRTKMRSKLMQHIRRVVPKLDHIHWPTPQYQYIDIRPWRSNTAVTTQELIFLYQQSQLITALPHPPFNPVTTCMNAPSLPYLQRDNLPQCMNAIRSPHRTKQTLSKDTDNTHKRKRYFSPITVPGTPPDTHIPDATPTDEDDLHLYYSICNRYRPEMGESNAESAERHLHIETEYIKRHNQNHKRRTVKQTDPHLSSTCLTNTKNDTHGQPLRHHSLSPFQPINSSLKFHSSRRASPII
jgi:hypothetical protein